MANYEVSDNDVKYWETCKLMMAKCALGLVCIHGCYTKHSLLKVEGGAVFMVGMKDTMRVTSEQCKVHSTCHQCVDHTMVIIIKVILCCHVESGEKFNINVSIEQL